MELAKNLNNYDFFNNDTFKFEYVGINFLDTIKSNKIYYQPRFSNIQENKVEFTKRVINEVYSNNSIINMIDYYSGTLLDFSAKNQNGKDSVRFNIRCPHKAYQNDIIYKTIKDLGFESTLDSLNRIIDKMNHYKNQKYDSLFIIGFSIEDEIISSIKYYFSIFNDEIIPDYSNFKKYHSEDEDFFYTIMSILNISKENIQCLKDIFNVMNRNKAYIGFLGIDYDKKGNSYYKIYYRIPEDFSFSTEQKNIIGKNKNICHDVSSFINTNIAKHYKFEYIAVAFTENEILQHQIYLSEGK